MTATALSFYLVIVSLTSTPYTASAIVFPDKASCENAKRTILESVEGGSLDWMIDAKANLRSRSMVCVPVTKEK